MCFTFFNEGSIDAMWLVKCIVCGARRTFDIHCVLLKSARARPPVADAALVLTSPTSHLINKC